MDMRLHFKSYIKTLILFLIISILFLCTGCNDTSHLSEAFEVHFLDVGQADAALIVCDGKTMLIDGGNVGDSNLIYSVLRKKGITYLDYIICTHPHEDHVGGLSGALEAAKAGRVFCSMDSYDSRAFQNFANYVKKQELELEFPPIGETISLGSASVEFLGPQQIYEDTNEMSIVVRIVYGETSFLFTGDAGRTSELDMLASGSELRSSVLKVGHHGSYTSTSYVFLREVMPKYAIISVGKDNDYGHPHEEVMSRLRDAEVTVYRTDIHGDIICSSDGENIRFKTDKNKAPLTTINKPDYYIGNVNSKVFHLPSCSSLPVEKNRIYFKHEIEATIQGYIPCSKCINSK
ncbi:MAG TPA: MBL fold metallo-hydrolase [Thermoanaerobacterales bacterium]|nr:MBL fold metallo-hydrolase [Thermoanaerobacterales bacterium]